MDTYAIRDLMQHADVLEIEIPNRSSALSRVLDLFARRACELDGVVYIPGADGMSSRMWVRVVDARRLSLLTKLIENMADVISVRRCRDQPLRRCFGQIP